jgi:hypothetical protein
MAMISAGVTTQGWLAQARRWRGHDKFTNFVINQGMPAIIVGLSVDPDDATGDYGAVPAAPASVSRRQRQAPVAQS